MRVDQWCPFVPLARVLARGGFGAKQRFVDCIVVPCSYRISAEKSFAFAMTDTFDLGHVERVVGRCGSLGIGAISHHVAFQMFGNHHGFAVDVSVLDDLAFFDWYGKFEERDAPELRIGGIVVLVQKTICDIDGDAPFRPSGLDW